MLFLNMGLLFGLLAVSIPVLIHLFNRKSARVVDWGAMKFLLDSLVSRRRRILLEEVLLLASRCMLLALVVLAAARPFISATSSVPWIVLMPMLLVAIALFGVSFAFWRSPRLRRYMLCAAIVLLVAVGLAILLERQLNLRRFGGKGRKDVALVIDASMSMTMINDGKSNVERARKDVDRIVAAAPGRTAFTIVAGGEAADVRLSAPVTDRTEILAALDDLTPQYGTMRALEALSAAGVALAQGDNPSKQIVVVTDGQRHGWEIDTAWRWQFLAQTFSHLPVPPQIIVHKLPMPSYYRNAALGPLVFNRKVIGLDRDVAFTVRVHNTGTEAITPSEVAFTAEGRVTSDASLGQIPPDGSETVTFLHSFKTEGAHVVTVRVAVDDDLPSDNEVHAAVNVISRLRVLLVDGNPSVRPMERASAFAAIALSPESGAPGETEGTVESPTEWKRRFFVQPEVVEAPRIAEVASFAEYDAVILADVPRLPAETALKLSDYVQGGGGLLVAPGKRALAAFYNAWATGAGDRVMPAVMEERAIVPAAEGAQAGVSPALSTFSHEALTLVANPDRSDIGTAILSAYWKLQPWGQDPAVQTGGMLDSGDPWLVERRLGEGRVCLLSSSLDNEAGDLATRQSFVPLVHELAYHLADAGMARINIEPGAEIALRLPVRKPGMQASAAPSPAGPERTFDTKAIDPEKRERQAAFRVSSTVALLRVAGAVVPGLYRVAIPEELKPVLGWLGDTEGHIPFTIARGIEESMLVSLTEADYGFIGQFCDIVQANSVEDVASVLSGKTFGNEIWRILALAAFALLLVEIALTRWIALLRQTGSERSVEFEAQAAPSVTFREQLRKMRGGAGT
jgi:hypothetical protein